ncbi:MAG: alpha/beta hydrolase fold domain-containing protein, partial [Comamonadaceae bacterium]
KLARLNLPLPQYRLAREAAALRLFKMPPDVTVQEAQLGGCRGEWLRPEAPQGQGIVLYLHGGAYTGGSCVTHRALAARLASAAKHSIFHPAYRLAPEHPFPAALDDALATYMALSAAHPDVPIAVSGDSAGAGLALALAVHLRDQAATPPAALALMSPWTDLALTNDTHRTKAAVDPFFPSTERLRVAALHYAGEARLRHPLVSPQYAELRNLPATLIHVGTREALLDDSLLLSQRMNAQGSKAEVKVFPGMWHVWQTLHGRMREADQSILELGAFLSGHLRGAA